MLVSDRKRADFNSKDMVQDLNRLLRAKRGETVVSNTLPELENQVNKTNHHSVHGASRRQVKQLSASVPDEFFLKHPLKPGFWGLCVGSFTGCHVMLGCSGAFPRAAV